MISDTSLFFPTLPAFPASLPGAGAARVGVEFSLDAVQKGACKIDKPGFNAAEFSQKEIIGHGSWNCYNQTNGSGDESFGDARRDGGKGGRFHKPDGVEGVHDAPYRAEQTDEGRGVGHSGEKGESGVETAHFLPHSL